MLTATPRLLSVVLVSFAILSAVGCDDPEGRLAISGTVTYDGQPLPTGKIGFAPQDKNTGKPSGGGIVDGRFEIPPSDGPTPGKYDVRIYAERPTGRKLQADEGSTEMIDQMEQYIPTIYNEQTTLTAEIKAEQEELKFDLEKPKRTKKRRRR